MDFKTQGTSDFFLKALVQTISFKRHTSQKLGSWIKNYGLVPHVLVE